LLRLYLDQNEGVASVRCPVCSRLLLPAAKRMGRMVVAYGGGFVARPGARVLLVCPSYECDYQEPVEIARTPQDAVVFSTVRAASRWQQHERMYQRTIGEIRQEIERLIGLYEQTANPKVPSAVKQWREKLGFSVHMARDYLERSYREDCEIYCRTKETEMRGKVKALLQDGVLFERVNNGGTVLIQTDDVHNVAMSGVAFRPLRFDFSDRSNRVQPGIRTQSLCRYFVVYGGQSLCYGGITKHGICSAHTEDPAVAHALGLPLDENSAYHSEFPAALADRWYILLRYCWVKGHRLYVTSFTTDPDVLELETRNLAAAQELHMRRAWTWCGQREALRWQRLFHRSEIEDEEEREVPIRMPRARRR